MKIVLDIHGVIDKNPDFFREFAFAIMKAGGEVSILTGKHIRNGVMEELARCGFIRGIHYLHLFSISDWHEKTGTKMWGTLENPKMDMETWNRTKGDYCKQFGIDLCIDDDASYVKHFATPVATYHYKEKIDERVEDKSNEKTFSGRDS